MRVTSPQGITRRSFLIGLGSAAAVGGGLMVARPWGRSPKPLRLGRLADLTGAGTFDVCIVGSGPAGAVVGRDLVRRGFRVAILESGFDLRSHPFDARLHELETYQSSGPIAYPVAGSRTRGIGGTSIVWSGSCTRFRPIDFEPNTYTPPNAPWPITYAEIEPYYARAEETLHVHKGIFASFHPTLSRELRKVGISVSGSPKSRQQLWGGPTRAANHLLPEFCASPMATLISGATVTRLIARPSGLITGAEARDPDGRSAVVRARRYVVACGALETPRLLLLSRSRAYPEGIGNGSGLVGLHFMEHAGAGFWGKITGWSTVRFEFGRSYEFYEEFKRRGLGGVILVFSRGRGADAHLTIGSSIEMVPSTQNRVALAADLKDAFGNPGLDLSFGYSEKDTRTLNEVRSLIRRIFSDLGAEEVWEPEGRSADEWGHHHMGTCRMGDDPETSVVDRDLRVHGTRNLYVAGSAVFVTSGAAHPTLLIVALSHRLADHLISRVETGVSAAARSTARQV